MTFLNPWMWLGAAAVGIPIAMHFFYRAHYRPLPWGAMKFLKLSIEQTSRKLRFQELILLILRILVCLILAFALARPAAETITGGGGRGESVDAVLLIDVSYSMDVLEGEGKDRKSRLEKAKDAAVKVIDNLPPDSTVQIFSCAENAVLVGPRTPTNLDQARHLIRGLKSTSLSTDFAEGFNSALATLEKTSGASKEVYLFSDMQRSGWDRQSVVNRQKCEEIKNQGTLYLVRCAEGSLKNISIEGILPQTTIPHVGSRVAFSVLIRNTGTAPIENIKLTLTIDEEEKESSYAVVDKLTPGESRPVPLTTEVKKAGWRLFTAKLESDEASSDTPALKSEATKQKPAAVLQDDLEDDNTFRRYLYVHEKVRILPIDGSLEEREARFTSTYFLNHALWPIPEEEKPDHHLKIVPPISPQDAAPTMLENMDVCILANVAAENLPADFVRALKVFVRSGKGLFIVAGPKVNPVKYNQVLGDLLPTTLIDEPPFESPHDAWATPDIDSIDVRSFLASLKQSGRNPLKDINRVATLRMIPVKDPRETPNEKNLGNVLLRFNNGRPMLISRGYGQGEVLLLTTTLNPVWNIFHLQELNHVLIAFANGCITQLVQRANNPFNQTAGNPVRWVPPDRDREYDVIPPGGDPIVLGKPVEFEGQFSLPVFDTSKAGIYKIVPHKEKKGEIVIFNPDLRESDQLETIDNDGITKQLGFEPAHLSTGFDGSSFTGTERSRKEWTIWALTALLIFTFVEMLWAWFCGRAW